MTVISQGGGKVKLSKYPAGTPASGDKALFADVSDSDVIKQATVTAIVMPSLTYGTTSGTVCEGDDSRLSNTRTPTDGSVTTAKISDDAVTYAKLQNVSATDRVLGRSSSGAGIVEEITCTSFARSILDDANAAAVRTTIDAAQASHTHGNITSTGAIGSTSGLPIITTTGGVLTTGSFGSSAGTFCQGNDSRLSDTRTPTDGSVTTAKIPDTAVTYAKIQNVSATDRILGRSSAGAGVVQEITCTSFARTFLDDADAAAVRTTIGAAASSDVSAIAFGGSVMRDRLWSALIERNTGSGDFYRLASGGYVDGFAVNPGTIDTGISNNENYGTKSWANSQTASNRFSATMNSNFAVNSTDYNWRVVIPASAISGTTTNIRVTLGSGNAATCTISHCFVGHRAASGDAYDFAETPTRLTFSGNNGITLSAGQSVVTDVVPFAYDDTRDMIISIGVSASGASTPGRGGVTGVNGYYRASFANDAGTVNVSGFTTLTNEHAFVSLVESLTNYDDMTLSTGNIVVPSAPASAYLMGYVDLHGGSPTINTHLVGTVSRNGGTNTSTVTLTDLGTVTSTRKMVAGTVSLTGQPSGTNLRVAWSTSGGHRFTFYGTAVELA